MKKKKLSFKFTVYRNHKHSFHIVNPDKEETQSNNPEMTVTRKWNQDNVCL